MGKKKVLPANAPVWITEELKISEPLYCWMFLRKHPMRYIGDTFFNEDGTITDVALLKQEICSDISGWVTSKLANKVNDLWNAMKMLAAADEIPIHTDRIHVANGTLYLDGRFMEEKQYCRNRLTVAYNPDAPGLRKDGMEFLQSASGGRGYSHFTGIPWLLPSSGYKGSENDDDIGRGGEW